MDNIKQELVLKINTGITLTVEEKELWISVIENIPESFYKSILDFINDEADGLRVLTENLKSKLNAVKGNDLGAFKEILEKDSEFLMNNIL